MSSRNSILPPFYILINDTDKKYIKYYHDVHFQGADYEGEVNNNRDNTIHIKGKTYHIGPRPMKHIEIAIRFRNKIAGIKKLDQSKLKIVVVEESFRATFKKIEQQEIKPFTFERVFK